MKSNQTGSFILALLALLVVFLVNMTISPLIPSSYLLLTRILMAALCGAGVLVFQIAKMGNARRLSYILMTVNLAFFIVSFFTTKLWGLDLETPRGIAYAKLSDSLVISILLIVFLFLAGYRRSDLFINAGRIYRGLFIGILSFTILALLAVKNPDQPIAGTFLKDNLGWIAIFIFSNAFMEELLFRGIFLKPLQKFMKPYLAVILTSVVFAASHLQVTYTTDVVFFAGITLLLGLIWGFLMNHTKSMIASFLFHAGADLLIILPIYSTFGAN